MYQILTMYAIIIVIIIAFVWYMSRSASTPVIKSDSVIPQCPVALPCPQNSCPVAPPCPQNSCPTAPPCPICPKVVCPACEKCPVLAIPASIANGSIVEGGVYRCLASGAVYKIENNTKRWYPNPTIYNKYGAPAITNVECEPLEQIPGGRNFW